MSVREPVRWGIISTANIVRSQFLPAVRAAGGIACAVGSRHVDRARQFASDNGIDRTIEGYENLVADEEIDAVYIATPNSLHAEWTIAALRAGKAVLCEKPLCASVAETESVLDVARETGSLLWEAFVFPFRRQTLRLREIITSGELGEVQEVQSSHHFQLRTRDNIRLSPELGGGALFDVGCYCIRLANLVFESDPAEAIAVARWAPEGVDEAMHGVVTYGGGRRLLFSCGIAQRVDLFARIIGSRGEVRLTNPFHPSPDDTLEVLSADGSRVEKPSGPEPSFTDAIRHIHAVLHGEEEPRHLAVASSLGVALGLQMARDSAYQRSTSADEVEFPVH